MQKKTIIRPVIMVVNDHVQNIELLEAFLAPEDYIIITAVNGEEALDKLSCNKIDLILLDVMMPGMDGFEVTRRIRQDDEKRLVPIILVTALRETEDRVKGIKAGCDDFLSNPVDKMELLARVSSLLKVKAYHDLLNNYRKELEFEVTRRTDELNNMMLLLAESNKAIRRFIPEQFLSQLGKSTIEEVKLGDHIAMNMVVMFADIRDFSTLSEKMTPEETFIFLNEYLARLGPPIRKHGGFIDKYIGDGIMALFPSSTDAAVRCAIEMQAELVDLNNHRKKAGLQQIKTGIGLHEGLLMLGTIGENERMDGTVISDTVNTASRIEGISKRFGISIAVSERILLGMEDIDAYHIRFLGEISVRGLQKKVTAFEIYDGDPEPLKKKKDLTRSDFEGGLNAFQSRNYEDALEFFRTVLSEIPDDMASLDYIRRIEESMKGHT